jgi:hypothetical protein
MTYASPAWEFVADTHLMKLQRLQNKVLRITGKFPRRTPVRELHMAFQWTRQDSNFPTGARHQDRLTDWSSIAMWLWLTWEVTEEYYLLIW